MTMNDFELPEELEALRDTVRRFAADEIAPHARQWDREAKLPDALIARLGELGLLGIMIPECHGGTEGGMRLGAVVIEEIARADGATALLLAAHAGLCATHLMLAGGDEQKRRFLPDPAVDIAAPAHASVLLGA